MSKFTVQFCTNNQAFQDDFEYELEQILRRIGEDVYNGHVIGRIRDTNGNRVGYWAHIPDDEEDE